MHTLRPACPVAFLRGPPLLARFDKSKHGNMHQKQHAASKVVLPCTVELAAAQKNPRRGGTLLKAPSAHDEAAAY
jgi:hypothetical protein